MNAIARIPLSAVCHQDRGAVRAGEHSELRYLGMESIEPGGGCLATGEFSKVPEANTFRFTSKHVLYGKLRPYLNKVIAPDFDGKCSTELVPLLPTERLDRQYLAYFLRSSETVEAISQKVAGARMPRADMSFVMSLSIPLPALEEQRRIVDLLSRAENIVRMRQEAKQKAREIIPALFQYMFGDQTKNQRGWEKVRLGDVAAVVSGVAKGRKFAGRPTREVPYMRVANVQAGHLNLKDMKKIPATESEIAELALQRGDVLLTEGGDHDKLGRGALLDLDIGECIHQNHVFRVRSSQESMVPEYFAAFLQTDVARHYFLKSAKKTTNLASINMTQLRSLPVVLPSMTMQRLFAARASQFRALADDHDLGVRLARRAFESMMAKVFSVRRES